MKGRRATGKRSLRPDDFKINLPSLLLSSLAINIFALALPVMTLQVYDRILPNPGSGTLPVLAAGVILAVALEAVLRLGRAYILAWSGASYEHRMSCKAMKHMLWADLSCLGAAGIGEHLHNLGAVGRLKDFHNGSAVVTLFDLVFVPVFLGVIIYIGGAIVLAPTAVLMAFTALSLWQGQRLRGALKQRDDADDCRYNFLIESLEGVHTLKSFALESVFSRRYEALEERSTHANFRVTEATSGTFNAGTVFSHVMVAAVISLGALLAIEGRITTGAMIAAVMLSGRMMQPVQRALVLWVKYQDYILARHKIETLFELPLHPAMAMHESAHAPGPLPERAGLLSLEALSFRRDETGPFLFEDIDFTAARGESILLSGLHGEAKTALFELIAGIHAPVKGRVLVDGIDAVRYPPRELIRHVGFIQAEGVIFRGTVRDNMTCFGQTPEEDARQIADWLQVGRDVATLPSGFDTVLSGGNTDSVPPGLKQRIAMVRVLAARPRLILFDGAERGLDQEGYSLVYTLLARLKGAATLLLVSDDLNIRALANKMAVFENGAFREDIVNPAPMPAYRRGIS